VTDRAPPPGFDLLHPPGRFVNRAGRFFVRIEADGVRTVGCWIGEDQANSEGFAHGGFLLAFADFALSFIVKGVTLNMTADFIRGARIGDWIQAPVLVRKRSSSLIFADTMISADGGDLMRVGGLFRPFEKKA
jgi:acyl-coenzyme A thioesterase PaaI-like protein